MKDFPTIYLHGDEGQIYLYQRDMSDVQRSFHACPDKFRWLGGGVGGGKSAAAIVEVLKQSWQHLDNYGFILRATFPEIRLSAHKDFKSVCPPYLIYEENRQEHWIDILNRAGYDFMYRRGGLSLRKRDQIKKLREIRGLSRVEFISFEGTLRGETKFRSANIGWYLIEQAESAHIEVYDALNERMRRRPSGRKAMFVSNPDGHNWLWRIFHPKSPDKRKHHTYFHVQSSDNPALPDDYNETLKDTYDKEKYAKMVLGSHDVATGAVFPELSRSMHVVEHFDPPSEWIKGIGLDSGIRNPTAAVFVAVLPRPFEGIYIFREYQESERRVSEHARYLKSLITPDFRYFEIDPETKKRDAVYFATIIGEYNACGIPFQAASNDVIAGINRIKEYLAYDSELRHPVNNTSGAPRLLISDRCPRLISQLHECRFEEQQTNRGFVDPPERIQTKNIHLVDALKYIILRCAPPLSVQSMLKKNQRASVNPYDSVKEHDFVDEQGKYSIGKLIERSHRVPQAHESRGQTTWLAT